MPEGLIALLKKVKIVKLIVNDKRVGYFMKDAVYINSMQIKTVKVCWKKS